VWIRCIVAHFWRCRAWLRLWPGFDFGRFGPGGRSCSPEARSEPRPITQNPVIIKGRLHADASPYVRYKSHPEEITLTVPAGSAVVVPSLLFHGSHPNASTLPRELVQFGYWPA